VGFNVLSRVTFPQLEISMFESQSFNERFRSDFIAAMAAEGALVQPGISTRHPLIHRIMSGSVVVESSLGFDTEQSAQIFQARVDGAPREVFKKMAAYGDIISDSATYQVLNSDYVGTCVRLSVSSLPSSRLNLTTLAWRSIVEPVALPSIGHALE
jgi:hypothetical protein